MSWEPVILKSHETGSSLLSEVEHLFACQRRDWELFREGEAALESVHKKALLREGEKVVVQSNPGRKKSTHAKTDAKSIAKRRCFLCPENMPEEERGIAFGRLIILPNPYPILSLHCTIPDREHRPQQICGRIGNMLELANCLGPEMVVFYNGPQCGASAPDHFHFQACRAVEIPIFQQIDADPHFETPSAYESFGRRFVTLVEKDLEAMQAKLEESVRVLSSIMGEKEEPKLNLIVRATNDAYQALLFPRAAHRPSCYFAEGAEKLAISPAALEMAGVLVIAEPEHFERVNTDAVHQIYSEVSLDSSRFNQFVETLT